jgi:hypothetical protein
MKLLIPIFVFLFVAQGNAQKYDCVGKTKAYEKDFEAKKINEAYNLWNEVVKNCPKSDEILYKDGIEILQYKADNALSEEEKEKLVRELLHVYDLYNTNFPLANPDFETTKAMTLLHYRLGTKEEIFTLLDHSLAKAANYITDANALYTYYNLYFEKYKADKKITSDMVLEKYTLINTMLEGLKTTKPEKEEEYATAIAGLYGLSKDMLTCDNLTAYYGKKIADNATHQPWLNSALVTLGETCSHTTVYNTLAEANYKIKATSKSAYYWGLANMKQRKFTEAIALFTESESLETNPLERAKLDYFLATGLLNDDKIKTKELLTRAISLDPKMSNAYLFLAEMYSNSADECGKSPFEKKTIYYLAATTALKAGVAEPRFKAAAEQTAKRFSLLAPTSAEIKNAKMNGKTITIGCWINETVTFPAK